MYSTGFRGYTSFCSRVLFPFQEMLKGHDSSARRRELEKSQWWSRAELDNYRLSRLRSFLQTVEQRVPYYEELFRRKNFDPSRLRSIADLSALPILSKDDIRGHSDEMRARGSSDLARFNTGGSSGEPLVFYVGKARITHDVAAKWRATRWWGVDIGDPEIVVWGSPIELGAQDRVRALRDCIFRTSLFPAFQLTDAGFDQFMSKLRSQRPAMLFGYPSVFAYIARYARAKGERLADLGIRVTFVTSERLYPDQRTIISEVFGCPVANGYGGRDAGFIAHECPHGGMHVSAEDIVIEIVDTQGRQLPAGRSGEIVVTHMATEEFPFIRYRTGDVGVLSDQVCACGRGLPLLEDIQGRTTDFILARNGTTMHGLALIYVVRDIPGIKKFKIVQETLDWTRVLLVTEVGFDPRSLEKIRTGFGKRLGEEVQIDIDVVNDIPAEASGKYRYIVSKVSAI